MTLWIILTIMTSAAAVLVAAPFLRRLDAPGEASAGDIQVYRDQLKEVDREEAGGSIDTDQAERARVEIKRRLLAADRAQAPMLARLSLGERNVAVVSVAGIVVLGAVGLYALTGRPELPSAPAATPAFTKLASRSSQSDAVEQLANATAAQGMSAPRMDAPQAEPQSAPRPTLPSVDEMIDRLASRLKQNPKDPEGWRMLGWSYFATERFPESAAAYAKAVELNPNVAALRSAEGEALVRAADGALTPEARGLFASALALDAKDPRARFFDGLMKEQAGDKQAALDTWVALLNDADPKEPWIPDLTQRTDALAGELGVDLSTRLHRPQAAPKGGVLETLRQQEKTPGETPSKTSQSQPPQAPVAAAGEKGPTAEDVRRAAGMAPADRMAMIRGMVDSLAARLDQSPRDVDGWIKLIRSRKVLGEADAAKQALDRALAVFSDSPQEKAQIAAAAHELGVTE
jgi:cytochrome c-type biogenesis protein CcmH